MKLKLIIPILFSTLFSFSFAQDDSEKSDENKSTEKTYTEQEFQKKLSSEIESKLKRLTPSELLNFTKELMLKEKKVLDREELLSAREQQLKMNELAFSNRIKDFESKQEKVIGCIDENDKDEQNRLNHLVNVVTNMKPASAAQLLSKQESSISVKILGKIEAERAAKIFNLMDQEISARLQKQYMTMKK